MQAVGSAINLSDRLFEHYDQFRGKRKATSLQIRGKNLEGIYSFK
jgi:hypothetical protein